MIMTEYYDHRNCTKYFKNHDTVSVRHRTRPVQYSIIIFKNISGITTDRI